MPLVFRPRYGDLFSSVIAMAPSAGIRAESDTRHCRVANLSARVPNATCGMVPFSIALLTLRGQQPTQLSSSIVKPPAVVPMQSALAFARNHQHSDLEEIL